MKRKQLYIFITGLLLSLNVFSQGNLKYEESLAAKSYNLNKYEENLSAYKSHLQNKLGIECQRMKLKIGIIWKNTFDKESATLTLLTSFNSQNNYCSALAIAQVAV